MKIANVAMVGLATMALSMGATAGTALAATPTSTTVGASTTLVRSFPEQTQWWYCHNHGPRPRWVHCPGPWHPGGWHPGGWHPGGGHPGGGWHPGGGHH